MAGDDSESPKQEKSRSGKRRRRRKRKKKVPAPSVSGLETSRVETALRLLHEEFALQLRNHPSGLGSDGGVAAREANEALEVEAEVLSPPPIGLEIEIPRTLVGKDPLAEAVDVVRRSLQQEVEAVVAHRSVVQPGCVFCLRCGSSQCEHASPGGPREVFTGYLSNGRPRFLDFTQHLIEVHDPRAEELAKTQRGASPVVRVVSGEALNKELLEVFSHHVSGFRLHGQVEAGWFLNLGGVQRRAVCIQALSSGRAGQRRVALAVVTKSMEPEPDRTTPFPWAEAVSRGRRELVDLVERNRGSGGDGATDNETAWDEAVLPILERIEQHLLRQGRAKQRLTRHAEQRRVSGRPTQQALADMSVARPDQFLMDVAKKTLVVLGKRGRTHVFGEEGKLVTSMRTEPAAVDRRKRQGKWRQASAAEVARLQEGVARIGSRD